MRKIIVISFLLLVITDKPVFANDMDIPWAANTGGTESIHIAGKNEDLNYTHQAITKTKTEGRWATGSGSISQDELALSSDKPKVSSDPTIMPHQL